MFSAVEGYEDGGGYGSAKNTDAEADRDIDVVMLYVMCVRCPEGKYVGSTGQVQSACEACPVGQYSSHTNVTTGEELDEPPSKCYTCPVGCVHRSKYR